jgi:hypothetical protein
MYFLHCSREISYLANIYENRVINFILKCSPVRFGKTGTSNNVEGTATSGKLFRADIVREFPKNLVKYSQSSKIYTRAIELQQMVCCHHNL